MRPVKSDNTLGDMLKDRNSFSSEADFGDFEVFPWKKNIVHMETSQPG